jgi:large subunit ribosomal protein L4
MKLKVFSSDGENTSEKDFAIPSFDGDKGLKALRQVLLSYLANKRQGTHSTKTSSTVHGTGKKPFRQKGTGQARQGARNRNQHYHGAVTHGPHPRDYSQKISKKLKRLAFSRALFDRAVAGEVEVIERFEVAEPKTRLFNQLLTRIQGGARKVLIVDDSWAHNTLLAARNIERLSLQEASDLNALDLAQYDKIIISEKGIDKVLNRIAGDN